MINPLQTATQGFMGGGVLGIAVQGLLITSYGPAEPPLRGIISTVYLTRSMRFTVVT